VRRAALISLALVLPMAGCTGPQVRSRTATDAASVAQAQRTHEFPAPSATARGRERVHATRPDPVSAVRSFATAYINWTAATVTARLRALASLSVGQARAAMTLGASETARDYELHRSRVANQGMVEAVAPVSGRRRQFVVVTREVTTATATAAYRGLHAAWHVALATVTAVPGGGWALSGWQPEN
jgi:hypothetical protein